MGILSDLKTAAADPRRFIGRKGSPCRKCRGAIHYVPRAGGILCHVCSPPAAGDVTLRIEAVQGIWQDADSGFATPAPATTATTPATVLTGDYVPRLDRRAAVAVETAWHAFAADFRDWGWIDSREFIEFNNYAMAVAEAGRISNAKRR